MTDVLQDLLSSLKTVFIDEGAEVECNSSANISNILAFAKGYEAPHPGHRSEALHVPDEQEDFDTMVYEEFVSMNERIRQCDGQDHILISELENWRRKWLKSVSPTSSRASSAASCRSVHNRIVLSEKKGVSRRYRWIPIEGKHTVRQLLEKRKPQAPLLTYSEDAFRRIQDMQRTYERAAEYEAVSNWHPGARDCPVDAKCGVCCFSTICLNCTLTKRRNPLYQQGLYTQLRMEMCKAVEDMRVSEEDALQADMTDAQYDSAVVELRKVFNKLLMNEPWVAWLRAYDTDLARISRETDEKLISLTDACSKEVAELRSLVSDLEADKNQLREEYEAMQAAKDKDIRSVQAKLAMTNDKCTKLEAQLDFAAKKLKLQRIFSTKRTFSLAQCRKQIEGLKQQLQDSYAELETQEVRSEMMREVLRESLQTIINGVRTGSPPIGSVEWIGNDLGRRECARESADVLLLLQEASETAISRNELYKSLQEEHSSEMMKMRNEKKEMEMEIHILTQQVIKRGNAQSPRTQNSGAFKNLFVPPGASLAKLSFSKQTSLGKQSASTSLGKSAHSSFSSSRPGSSGAKLLTNVGDENESDQASPRSEDSSDRGIQPIPTLPAVAGPVPPKRPSDFPSRRVSIAEGSGSGSRRRVSSISSLRSDSRRWKQTHTAHIALRRFSVESVKSKGDSWS